MKKLISLTAVVTSLLTPVTAFAQSPITINPPKFGYPDLGSFVNNVITLAFTIAVLVVLFMLIWGAFEWIVSGGDKEAVGKARNRILNALIGLAVLAIAFALATVGAQFLGFPGGLTGLVIPTPPPAP